MVGKNLSIEAKNVIQNYLHLPLPHRQAGIPGHDIACPYYNNRRNRVRGALRVLVGKGSVEDIVQEVRILSLKEKINLEEFSNEQIKEFLVDRNIGIDCSALAYYILNAELKAQNKSGLNKHLRWPNGGLFRRLLRRLRPVENTNVDVLVDDRNSVVVRLQDIQPGDFIVMLGFGPNHDRDHILIVHEIEKKYPSPVRGGQGGVLTKSQVLASPNHPPSIPPNRGENFLLIHYTHSLQWSADGKYNHGVRQGHIEISNPAKSLIEQAWTEQGVSGEQNETWKHARDSERLEIRRLRALA